MPVLLIAAVLFFLLCSALFSASETALFSIPRERLWGLRTSSSQAERWVYRLLADGQRTLLLILLGNIFVNVTIVGLVDAIVRYYRCAHHGVVTMVSATLVILVFGEMAPKNVALRSNETISRLIAPILYHVSIVLRPLLGVAQSVNSFFLGLVGRRLRAPSPYITLEELSGAADEFAAQGAIQPHERDSIVAVLSRGAQPVRRFMVYRSQMVAVDVVSTCGDALERMRHARQTVAMVYRRRADEAPLGMVHASVLLALPAEAPVKQHVEETEFVPGSMETAEVIGLMVREKLNGVCVLDEFGGYVGYFSITLGLESLLSRAVQGGTTVEPQAVESEREADGLEHLETLGDWVPREMLEAVGEVRTLNGLLVNYLGRIPEKGEAFAVGEVTFYIMEVGATAIRRVRISRRGREL